jgi:DNA-binding transcriptional LysR family regulator
MGTSQRYKDLHPGQLRAFCAVVRHKTFSAAARNLGLSHPVVWQQVRALERDYGGSLLEKHGRTLELTEDGRTLFELASSIVASMDSLQQAFQDRRRALPQTLVVAGSASVFAHYLAQLVVDFCRQHPAFQLSLLTYQNKEIEELVASGQADTAVMPHGPIPTPHPLLVSEVLCHHRWHLVMPVGHPLAHKRRIRAADLVRDSALILPNSEDNWRKQVDDVLRGAGVLDQLPIAVQINNSLVACRFVSLGLGITVTPYSPARSEFPNLCSRPLDHLFPDEHLVVLWRRGATPRPQARRFIDFARQYLAEE